MNTESTVVSSQATYRKDYQPPAFQISEVDLTFFLDDTATRVQSRLQLQRVSKDQTLRLHGEHIELLSVRLNGKQLKASEYQLTGQELSLEVPMDSAELCIETELNPSANKALEGLYKSAGTFCTQCEAEGFRRITYMLDRPDVLATYTTTIIADKQRYPYLLSNGNEVERCDLDGGKHQVKWHDPHPKPCYLFALVAGDFDLLEDHFSTQDGRNVLLQLFVDKGNLDQAQHAMISLKNAMKWDEERFNLSYDLDIYMVVAVDFFNMGAMENKGLNVFNSKYVLANPNTGTDQDFLNIESVIGHEYFHNWTGNRITCRDWFQLSLKEGLTVFRDQEFSADLGSRAVNRIQDVQIIRTHQFNEDASPMAHPIRPDKVVEMNNFYTVTVYNKGAEVIRMMHTLLGEQGFQRGMQEYVRRHDGQAVTCEDFVVAMEVANQVDFKQFRHWYSQAGTPQVSISSRYDDQGSLSLRVSQQTAPTPGQADKAAFHIPILMSAYTKDGKALALQSQDRGVRQLSENKVLLELTEAEQSFEFSGLTAAPVLSLLENFSAPVRLHHQASEADLQVLAAHADDAFVRWDAIQCMLRNTLTHAIDNQQPAALGAGVVSAMRGVLSAEVDPAFKALALATPSVEEIAENYTDVPLDAIVQATADLKRAVAKALQPELEQSYQALTGQLKDHGYELNSKDIAARSLRNRCLHYLSYFKDTDHSLQHYQHADNMTDKIGALQAAVWTQSEHAEDLLAQFAAAYQGQVLVMDKWLSTQAAAGAGDVIARVNALLSHPAFSWDNPNRIYALLATFSRNMKYFHQADGSGYQLLFMAIKRLNASNPQVASRLITPFLQWRRFDTSRQALMKECLQQLEALPDLAKDLMEKVTQSLNTANEAEQS